MITERVKDTILNNSLIEKGEHIVIGLSGGPDSVCLFHILYRLREELNIRLHAVHINHGLRPGAADEDQRYAEALCAAHQIPCASFYFDVKRIAEETGTSSEDAGRQVRYQSFFEVGSRIASETGASVKIAVAQNRNDQAETVLMRILRGTGTDGLCGIEYLREEKGKGVVIRPLLDVSRDEIEEYCRENGLNPRIDLTNLEPVYTRNKIRLELLPYLSENFNVNITAALNRLSKIAKEDKDYFSQKVEAIIAEHAVFQGKDPDGKTGGDSSKTGGHWSKALIPLEVLRGEHPAVGHRLMIRIFENVGLSQDITAAHLEQADRLLKEGRTSSLTDFTGGYVMGISYDTVEFYKKRDRSSINFEYELNIEGTTEISELNARIGVKILRRQDLPERPLKEAALVGRNKTPVEENKATGGSNTCRLSYDKIAASGCSPVVRSRRPGDYIVPLGMRGRKKLQDFFVDEKYSRGDRDRIPILCLGQEVIWVAGGRISENYKVDDSTERIILLEYSVKM